VSECEWAPAAAEVDVLPPVEVPDPAAASFAQDSGLSAYEMEGSEGAVDPSGDDLTQLVEDGIGLRHAEPLRALGTAALLDLWAGERLLRLRNEKGKNAPISV